MTDAVKVCPICDIAGCVHIRERIALDRAVVAEARVKRLHAMLDVVRADALREARDRAIAAEIRWSNIAYDNRQAGRDDNNACARASMAADIGAEIVALIDKEKDK